MTIKFTNPCPSGKLEGSSFFNKSKLTFETSQGGQIISPYDGVVTESSSDRVVITHIISGEQWESKLKNFRTYVSKGKKVREGDAVGLTDNGKFTFEVSPSVDAEKLITIGIESFKVSGAKKIDSDEIDPETGNKREREREQEKRASDDLLKVFFSPFDFAQGALGLDDDKKSFREETQRKMGLIKEDIDRIKKLF